MIFFLSIFFIVFYPICISFIFKLWNSRGGEHYDQYILISKPNILINKYPDKLSKLCLIMQYLRVSTNSIYGSQTYFELSFLLLYVGSCRVAGEGDEHVADLWR